MDPNAFTEINKEILRTCLEGFAKRGFSGDLEFRYDARQVLRTALEYHVLEGSDEVEAAIDSVTKNWQRISEWVNHNDETLLRVKFQKGKITRVDVRNRIQRWELIPEPS
jgi:hypothetical protein